MIPEGSCCIGRTNIRIPHLLKEGCGHRPLGDAFAEGGVIRIHPSIISMVAFEVQRF